MAITATANYAASVDIPDTYTNPTLPTLANKVLAGETFITDLAGTLADPTPATTAANIVSAVETFFETDYAINTLKQDATATITAALSIKTVQRVNDAATLFESGTEVYRVTVSYNFE